MGLGFGFGFRVWGHFTRTLC